jgi:hypothetical protein
LKRFGVGYGREASEMREKLSELGGVGRKNGGVRGVDGQREPDLEGAKRESNRCQDVSQLGVGGTETT